MIFALVQFISFLRVDDQAEWLRSWGLPNGFSDWRYGPLAFIVVVLAAILIAEWFVRTNSRKAERQFETVALPERAEFLVTETEITMKSSSAVMIVPLNKVTGLALSKDALAIGISGAGMIIPRSAFATLAEETAFIRSFAKGMGADALQRSSEAVRKLL